MLHNEARKLLIQALERSHNVPGSSKELLRESEYCLPSEKAFG